MLGTKRRGGVWGGMMMTMIMNMMERNSKEPDRRCPIVSDLRDENEENDENADAHDEADAVI